MLYNVSFIVLLTKKIQWQAKRVSAPDCDSHIQNIEFWKPASRLEQLISESFISQKDHRKEFSNILEAQVSLANLWSAWKMSLTGINWWSCHEGNQNLLVQISHSVEGKNGREQSHSTKLKDQVCLLWKTPSSMNTGRTEVLTSLSWLSWLHCRYGAPSNQFNSSSCSPISTQSDRCRNSKTIWLIPFPQHASLTGENHGIIQLSPKDSLIQYVLERSQTSYREYITWI